MKHVKTYNELNESKVFDKYSRIQYNILKSLNLNLYFMKKYGTVVTSIYQIFELLIKNDISYTISSKNCVLLTICALSNIFNESKQNIDKIMMIVYENDFKGVLNTFTTTINDLYTLFIKVSILYGKQDIIISDMLSYSTLFVPFIKCVNLFINKYNINFVDFNNIINNSGGISKPTTSGQININLDFLINYIKENLNLKITDKGIQQYNNFVQKFEN